MKKRIIYILLMVIFLSSINVQAQSKTITKKNLYNVRYDNKSKYQKLDIYYPKRIKRSGNNKVLLFIHGGSYAGGNKRDYYRKNQKYFNDAGIIYISINYRRSGIKKYPGAIDDAKTAIRFIKANYKKLKVNPNKIILMGHSAGANLASIVASTPKIKHFGKEKIKYKRYNNSVAGFIGIAGYYDTQMFLQKPTKTNKAQRQRIVRYYYNKNKKIYKQNLVRGNALRYVSGIKVPTLLISGKEDKTISYTQTLKYCNYLKKKKKKANCFLVPKKGHSLAYFQNSNNFKTVIDYIKKR